MYEEKKKPLIVRILLKSIVFIICLGTIAVFFPKPTEKIKNLIVDKIMEDKKTVNDVKNKYYSNEDYIYYQNIDLINPKNKNELLNSFRTIANAGVTKYSFYCNSSYTDCIEDASKIMAAEEDSSELYEIETFNHPFNDYTKINLSSSSSLNHIDLSFEHKYSEEQIEEISKEIDRLFTELYNPDLSIVDNIRIFNNFIINNTEYDENMASSRKSEYHSDTAYGVLFEGHGVCTGYADTMYLFLEKLRVSQFRIVNNSHTWNVVNIDGKWLHLDVTWNDTYYMQNRFFLIDTNELWRLDTDSHLFNENIYREVL